MLSPSAVAAVRDAARAVLAGDDAPVFRLPADVTTDAFVEATDRHRLLPFFSLNLDRLDLDDDLRATIAARGQRERMPALMMARELFRAVDALTDAGVRVLTFKGIALAQQAYGDFTARGSGDLDLLVSPDDLVTARTALLDAGWVADPAYPEPGPSWAWRFMIKNYYEVALHSTTSVVDLHWRLDPAPGALDPFETLWGRRVELVVAGRLMPTLSPRDAFAHTCSHAAKDDWAWLRSLVDVCRLAHVIPPSERRLSAPTRAQAATVGVAIDQLGLEFDASEGHGRSAHHLQIAESRQEGEIAYATGRVPGYQLATHLRRSFRAVTGVADLVPVTSSTLMPPSTLGGITAPSFVGGLKLVIGRRARRGATRFREWVRLV